MNDLLVDQLLHSQGLYTMFEQGICGKQQDEIYHDIGLLGVLDDVLLCSRIYDIDVDAVFAAWRAPTKLQKASS